jgi:hypothetical protein
MEDIIGVAFRASAEGVYESSSTGLTKMRTDGVFALAISDYLLHMEIP